MTRARIIRPAAAAVLVAVALGGLFVAGRAAVTFHAQVTSQQLAIATLQRRIAKLESRDAGDADWSAVAAEVEPSVVTIDTGVALGSGWVANADASGSDLITNYHVVADSYSAGTSAVLVRHRDRTVSGTIVRVDVADDLALIHVADRLTPLLVITVRPRVGTTVMAVGSPLGLDGTISVGVVSGYRSLEGSDYMQFSAAISPGNSGGPVVDERGNVVAIASAKLVGEGVEALALGIPVQVACGGFVVCSVSRR